MCIFKRAAAFLLALLLVLNLPLAALAAEGDGTVPNLTLSVEDKPLKVGDEFVVTASLDATMTEPDSFGYNIQFDPAYVEFVSGESDAPSLSTVEAIELAKKYGAEIMYDEESQAPFFFYTDTDGKEHEVWFEDARSYRAKVSLMEEYRLAGGFIWDLMRDNPPGFVTLNSLIDIQ